jgi:UPF0716 family protein affecting phage T7 exclusion
MGDLIKTVLLYVVMLVAGLWLILIPGVISGLFCLLIVIRYAYISRLHSSFWVKKIWYLENHHIDFKYRKVVEQYEIPINIITVLSIHKWKESSFIEDKFFLFDINYYNK